MVRKRIVLLANSRKHQERCLAGREISDQLYSGWVRPVSDRPGEGLNFCERQYQDRSEPAVLHIIDVPLIRPNAHACQTENWLASPNDWWVKQGVLTWDQAARLAETPATLWVNGFSTQNGINDEIPQAHGNLLTNSICMIRVPAVSVHVFTGYDRKKVHASFRYGGANYRFSLTDSVMEPQYKAAPLGTSNLGECLLTISLSEPFTKNDGSVCQYKLVAAIIAR